MVEKKGNMWSQLGQADIILVTANAWVKSNGQLVMGRGAALECAKQFPSTPALFGDAIKRRAAQMGFYGVIILPDLYDETPHLTHQPITGTHLGLFQVKYSWDEDAQVKLIRESIAVLTNLLYTLGGNWRVAMNYPGIGNGRLKKEQVDVFVKTLPDNVEVWQY